MSFAASGKSIPERCRPSVAKRQGCLSLIVTANLARQMALKLGIALSKDAMTLQPRQWATPCGGTHTYFKLPEGMSPTNATGSLPARIDVRSAGYVICAGAKLANGAGWFTGSDILDPAEAYQLGLIPELPQWLREMIEAGKVHDVDTPPRLASSTSSALPSPEREKAYGERALAGIAADLAKVTRGRNTALNNAALKAARQCAAGRITEADAKDALLDAAYDNGYIKKDGYSAFLATFRSGFNAGLQYPADPLEDKLHEHEEAWLDIDANGNIFNIETGQIVRAAPANRNEEKATDLTQQKPRRTLVKPLAKFVAEYVPLSYTLDGISPSGSIYF